MDRCSESLESEIEILVSWLLQNLVEHNMGSKKHKLHVCSYSSNIVSGKSLPVKFENSAKLTNDLNNLV